MRNDDVLKLVKAMQEEDSWTKVIYPMLDTYWEDQAEASFYWHWKATFRKESVKVAKKNVDDWYLWVHNQEDFWRSEVADSWQRNLEEDDHDTYYI